MDKLTLAFLATGLVVGLISGVLVYFVRRALGKRPPRPRPPPPRPDTEYFI
jgi:hypothetical protein